MRILLVEDNADMREMLCTLLKRDHFAVDTAEDGLRAIYLAKIHEYDLIILDNMLPQKTGLEVCTELRQTGNHVPILLLSVRSDAAEKAKLIRGGADDYMSKPYSYEELLARVHALTRRSPVLETPKLEISNLVLDPNTCEVHLNEKELYLTNKEFSLLELLLKNKGRIVSRGNILEHVWDMQGDPFSKTIETHIVNLRRKIETGNRKLIHTIRGRGYKISESDFT